MKKIRYIMMMMGISTSMVTWAAAEEMDTAVLSSFTPVRQVTEIPETELRQEEYLLQEQLKRLMPQVQGIQTLLDLLKDEKQKIEDGITKATNEISALKSSFEEKDKKYTLEISQQEKALENLRATNAEKKSWIENQSALIQSTQEVLTTWGTEEKATYVSLYETTVQELQEMDARLNQAMANHAVMLEREGTLQIKLNETLQDQALTLKNIMAQLTKSQEIKETLLQKRVEYQAKEAGLLTKALPILEQNRQTYEQWKEIVRVLMEKNKN